jgi:hypothetical protein
MNDPKPMPDPDDTTPMPAPALFVVGGIIGPNTPEPRSDEVK